MAADLAPLLGSDKIRPDLLFRYMFLAIGQGLALFPSVHFQMLRSQLHAPVSIEAWLFSGVMPARRSERRGRVASEGLRINSPSMAMRLTSVPAPKPTSELLFACLCGGYTQSISAFGSAAYARSF